ncbi:CheR family methyltransferase [Sphingomonas solaris]|uniref:Protein-glutamate O-methyltransferase CheR n=1 Tax=Alterirhizorhabdus solaris TaxID=2529389 RepID=A0A558QWX2_9SPHN|nr:protein-glutamate O-methyltransferase CheR [Sphingomonas solaris]TVV71598.1 protein-glutamate O-methyltransferase CheR [Sphingomonas solaris]
MDVSPATLRHFADLFHARTGQELAAGRRWRIETALRPLLRNHRIDSLDRLAGAVAGGGDTALADAVVDALLNNETSFFRDGATFRQLEERLFATFAAARAQSRRLRIWCAGCSTGQEAYSVAMMIAATPDRWEGWRIELTGTDLSGRAIAQARDGVYSPFEIQRGLPIRDMMRWFEPDGENWRAKADLRARVTFSPHNLLDPPPAGLRADIILCRNVMLYLAPDRRRHLFASLASVLADDGVLMLGAGETVLGQSDLFVPDTTMRGIYRRA